MPVGSALRYAAQSVGVICTPYEKPSTNPNAVQPPKIATATSTTTQLATVTPAAPASVPARTIQNTRAALASTISTGIVSADQRWLSTMNTTHPDSVATPSIAPVSDTPSGSRVRPSRRHCGSTPVAASTVAATAASSGSPIASSVRAAG